MNGWKPVKRHYGMDWLRIGAFAILILYHSALYFGPHTWVVRAHQTYDWLAVPLVAIAPWRLMVLFAVSGFATAAMLGKMGQIWSYLRERSVRLLIPLIFGMLVIVPPQSWARVVVDSGYRRTFFWFWTHEEFTFGTALGHTLPHWEHLWFLAYLWAYTVMLMVILWAMRQRLSPINQCAAFLARGHWLLAPVLLLSVVRLAMLKLHLTGNGMFDDWLGHSHYVPAFILGFLVAIHPPLWDAIRRTWKGAAFIAASAGCALMIVRSLYPLDDGLTTPVYILANAADSAMGWSAMIVALYFADGLLNRDHPLRPTLARAVFPAYMVHQTVIVLVGWWLLAFQLPGLIAFAIIVTAVIAASIVAFRLADRFPLIGHVLGVTPKPGPVQPARAVV